MIHRLQHVPQPHRILLVNSALGEGGTERQVAVVARALDPARFQVHIAAMRPGGFREDEIRASGLPIFYLPISSFKSPGMLHQGLRLIRYIRSQKIDLVHCFDAPSVIFATMMARLASRPVVLTSQRAHRNLTPGFFTTLLRSTDKIAHGNVVNCEAMRRHLIDDEGVAPSQVHLCYNGIDIHAFHPPEPSSVAVEAYRAPEFGGAKLVIGIICVQRPEKGLTTLVDAFIDVAATHPEAHLALVGSGPVQPELRRRVSEAGLDSRVHFIQQTASIHHLYRGIDIFVLPSLSEALSNSLMEAMASGCCPVATNVGGNPELVDHGVNGLLFPAGDAPALANCLRQLINNSAQRHAFAQASRQRVVSQFSTEASIATMERIYTSFL